MGNFKHETIDLGYDDLSAKTGAGGRTYTAPDGSTYPSITTVLSILSRDSIQAWRPVDGEPGERIPLIVNNKDLDTEDLIYPLD